MSRYYRTGGSGQIYLQFLVSNTRNRTPKNSAKYLWLVSEYLSIYYPDIGRYFGICCSVLYIKKSKVFVLDSLYSAAWMRCQLDCKSFCHKVKQNFCAAKCCTGSSVALKGQPYICVAFIQNMLI